ncbi:MAG: histidine kinase, partial [bacterium]|nr:histidine kinase [bacterium]
VAIAFGAMAAHEITFYLAAEPSDGLYTGAFMLLLPYSLLRWGAGREIVPGVLMMTSIAVLTILTGNSDIGEGVAGIVFLLFPAELGAAIRYQASSRVRRADQIRLREREQLARELHDTVAHHVSAIAIQAQAGRTVAATDPDAAVRALDAIETEASRSLAEMRAMVGVLRS